MGGKPLIGLGFTKENIQKLREGMPILLSSKDVKELTEDAVDAHILIMYGDTTEDITAQLSTLITDQTKIKL
jgi:hypothetical protein